MTAMPRGSPSSRLAVIIPVYNGMPFLPDAIRSILDQTLTGFRLYLVDDGSSDDSVACIRSFADPRITLLHRPHGGYSRLMNSVVPGLQEPLVAVLHQDDLARPDRLERQVDFLDRQPGCAAVFCQLELIGATGRRLGFRPVGSGAAVDDYDPEVFGSLIHTGACFRRERFLALNGYRAELYPAADYDLLLRLSEQGRVAVLRGPLVQYRYHAGANTCKVFRRMALMGRYAKHLHELRVRGEAEVSLDDYRRAKERSVADRWHHYRIETGRWFYRRAASCVGGGYPARGLAFLAAAMFFIPVTVARTLRAYARGSGQDRRPVS